jgi:cytochrome c
MRNAAIVFVFIALMISAVPTQASEISTKEQVVAMVHRVQEKYKKDGLEAAVAAVNDKSTSEFHDRDLYAFIYNMQGICLANGARPALVGKNLISLKDQDGNFLIQQMLVIATSPGSGWLSYKWPSPVTDKIEDRSAYIEKMGDYFVGVGMDH